MFQYFESGYFDVNDKERDGAPKNHQNAEPEKLLDIDTCETLKELSAALDVDRSAVGKRGHVLGVIQQAENGVLHELQERDIKRRLGTYEMLL
ncbi:hypothetical protein Trydic_g8892 [Trypoxylus dichotomus]